MSDPSTGTGGYECHGPMTAILSDPTTVHTDEPVIAFLCETCGVWRHALRWSDPRRVLVERVMQIKVYHFPRGPR